MADVTQLIVPVKNGSTITMTTLDIKDAGIWDLVPSSASASNPLLVSADVSGKFEVQGTGPNKYDVVCCSNVSFPDLGSWKSLPLEGNGTLFTSIHQVTGGDIELFGVTDMNLAKGSIVVFSPPQSAVVANTVRIKFVDDLGNDISSWISVSAHLKAVLAKGHNGTYSKLAIILTDGYTTGTVAYEVLCLYNSDSMASFNGRDGAVVPVAGDYSIDMIAPTSGATAGQIPVLVNVGTTQEPELEFQLQNIPSAGVDSFNSRTGAVVPASGDYSLGQISATGTAGQVPVLDGSGNMSAETFGPVYYGTCSTNAALAAKVVSTTGSGKTFRLQSGCIVAVYFSNGNTASAVTLNVDGTGATPVRDDSDSSGKLHYKLGLFMYINSTQSGDGSAHWVVVGGIDTAISEASVKGFAYLSSYTVDSTYNFRWHVTTPYGYKLVKGAVSAFQFTTTPPDNLQLVFDSISETTYSFKHNGSALPSGTIKTGDVVTFMIDGTNLQVLSIYPASTASTSGHTIENPSGTAMTARANLQFKGLSVTDDSTNDRTVVELSVSGTASAGAFLTSDGSGGYQWTTIPQAEGSSF